MIVISDNSELSALAEADLLDLLPRLFGVVIIPEAVRRECAHRRAPQPLRDWISQPPDWLQIVPDSAELLTETRGLGPGEAAAITLAWVNRKSSKLILDEKRGREILLLVVCLFMMRRPLPEGAERVHQVSRLLPPPDRDQRGGPLELAGGFADEERLVG